MAMDLATKPVGELFEISLSASLDTLVVPDIQVRADPAQVVSWDLPDADRHALTRWGLPRLVDTRFVPIALWGSPSKVSHDGPPVYPLGELPNLLIGAVVGTGQVLGLRSEIVLPPVFQATLPPVVYVNSSVILFVEWTWRWFWAHRALVAMPSDDATHARLDCLWERIRAADPAADGDSSASLWKGLIEGW
jgi:SUKH-4 immunity protein